MRKYRVNKEPIISYTGIRTREVNNLLLENMTKDYPNPLGHSSLASTQAYILLNQEAHAKVAGFF